MSEECGLDRAIPKREKDKDIFPMKYEMVIVPSQAMEVKVSVCRESVLVLVRRILWIGDLSVNRQGVRLGQRLTTSPTLSPTCPKDPADNR
jgi:hypothetical protein